MNSHSEPHWFPAQYFVTGLDSLQKTPQKAIKNVHTEFDSLLIEGHMVPLTRNQTEYDNSYVCSPYTAYIDYARSELKLFDNKSLRWLLQGVITTASGLLQLGQINQTLSINNWLFSTNIVPHWRPETVQQFTHKLALENPLHSLSIRSLNRLTDAPLIDSLTQNNWILLPARQVYLFESNQAWWKRNNVQNDQRLLRKTALKLVRPNEHQPADFTEIETCFNQLFIEKHSALNPQFSAEYFEFLHRYKLIEFFSFRDDHGRIVASIGLFCQQNLITAPIVGYDTSLPKSLGLYRLLMAVLLKETHTRQLPLNLSSGAGSFKRQRGGTPTIEYTALYIEHLALHQRLILRGFSRLLNYFAPDFFKKHQL